MEKLSFSGYTMYFRWRHVSHSTRIILFDFDDNFRRYSLWVRPFSGLFIPLSVLDHLVS